MVLENQCPAKGKLVLNAAVIFRQPHHHIINYCVKKKLLYMMRIGAIMVLNQKMYRDICLDLNVNYLLFENYKLGLPIMTLDRSNILPLCQAVLMADMLSCL